MLRNSVEEYTRMFFPRATKGGRGRGRSSHEDVVSVAALQELDVTAALGQNP